MIVEGCSIPGTIESSCFNETQISRIILAGAAREMSPAVTSSDGGKSYKSRLNVFSSDLLSDRKSPTLCIRTTLSRSCGETGRSTTAARHSSASRRWSGRAWAWRTPAAMDLRPQGPLSGWRPSRPSALPLSRPSWQWGPCSGVSASLGYLQHGESRVTARPPARDSLWRHCRAQRGRHDATPLVRLWHVRGPWRRGRLTHP